jgi:hypothetical protein
MGRQARCSRYRIGRVAVIDAWMREAFVEAILRNVEEELAEPTW